MEDQIGEETRLFKNEERMSGADTSAFLAEMSKKLTTGKVLLRQGEQELELNPPSSVILEV